MNTNATTGSTFNWTQAIYAAVLTGNGGWHGREVPLRSVDGGHLEPQGLAPSH